MRTLPLDSIDLADRSFKISRDLLDDGFVRSVRESGVLDPPLVLDRGARLVPVFGHNRLRALGLAGRDRTPAVVVDVLNPGEYVAGALLKHARGELGPVGKIRLAGILASGFGVGEGDIRALAARSLAMPADFAAGPSADAVLALPPALRDYLDARDISFKTIRLIAGLPRDAVGYLDAFASPPGMKVNSFRAMVDMLAVMAEREGAADYASLAPAGTAGPAAHDAALEALRAARYPRYAGMKRKADSVVSRYAALGVRVDYPPHFEGDSLTVSLELKRGEDPAVLLERLSDSDPAGLAELLDLL